jgi:hypothetical protein
VQFEDGGSEKGALRVSQALIQINDNSHASTQSCCCPVPPNKPGDLSRQRRQLHGATKVVPAPSLSKSLNQFAGAALIYLKSAIARRFLRTLMPGGSEAGQKR